MQALTKSWGALKLLLTAFKQFCGLLWGCNAVCLLLKNQNHLLPLSFSTSSIDHSNHPRVRSWDCRRIYNKDISYHVFVIVYHHKTAKIVLVYQRYLRTNKCCSYLKEFKLFSCFFIFLLFTHCWHQWDWNPERVLRAVFYQGFWGCGIKMIIIFKYISTYVTRIHALAHNLHQLLQKKHWSVALWRCSAQPGQNYGTSSFSPTVSHQDLHMCVSSWEVMFHTFSHLLFCLPVL